jgi:putative transposase
MPNHFHILIKQKTDNGISKFMANIQNSYARYFNTKHKRIGPLFQGQFKAVKIESEEQLLHVSRYIHLNPYSSALVKNYEELEKYEWSSLKEYLNTTLFPFCSKDDIQEYFKKEGSYKEFVFDNADYQKRLEEIKHLILD